MMSTLRRFLRGDDQGQSLVEFALVLPIILLIVTGLFDVGRAVWQENTLAYAAREGTRYAIVHGTGYCSPSQCPDPAGIAWPGNTAQVAQVVQQAAVGVSGVVVVTTWPDNCYDRNCRVAVEATAPFVPLPSAYMLGSAFQITLKGGSQLVIQR